MKEQLKVIISAEISNLKKGMQDAKSEIKDFKKHYQNASKEVDGTIKKMGQGVTTIAKGVGGVALAATGALVGLAASTKEYRTEQAKLNTAFESAGASAEVAKTTYNDLYRVLGDSGVATEAAAHLAQLTTNEKDLSEWTTICQGVYATFGDSLPIEGLTEAANETAKVGTVTGSLADALNWAGISEDEFNAKLEKCNSEAEREQLIRETLNGVYKDAAATYEETAADVIAQNEAQAKLQETTAKLGEALAPVITAFTNFATEALALVTPYIQDLSEKYMPLLQEVLTTVTEKLGEAFNWLSQHKTVLAVMAGIIGAVVAAIGLYNAVAAIKAAMDAAQVTTIWGLVAAHIAQAAAAMVALAPYILIVAAIAAVIAIIVLCIKHWDKIKETIVKVATKVKEVVLNMVEAVVGFFQNIIDFVKNNFQAIIGWILNPFGSAFKLAYEKCEWFRGLVDGFVGGIKNIIQKGFELAKTYIINPIQNAYSTVTGIFDKIKSGITDKINAAKDAVKSAIDKIKGFFKFEWSLPKLKMPSISIKGKFGLNPPSVPKFSINWNALGGVFDKPTLFDYGGGLQGIGEDGAEAVVPLEKNTQWLDRIADKLAAKQGNVPIVLQVDGKTFAQVSIDSINALTRQKGTLGLNIV